MRISDWSSDVCSSDLLFMTCSALVFWFAGRSLVGLFLDPAVPENAPVIDLAVASLAIAALFQLVAGGQVIGVHVLRGLTDTARSEERRVGQECARPCRSRGSPYHKKKQQKTRA